MTDLIDVADKEAFTLFLRSKTALGRLTDGEVHAVLAFLENLGFKHTPVAASAAPPPAAPATPAAPSMLASLEAAIEKDVKAIENALAPAPGAPVA